MNNLETADKIIKDIELLDSSERNKLLEYMKKKFFSIHFEPIKAGSEWSEEEDNE